MANVAVDLGDRSVRLFGKSGDGYVFVTIMDRLLSEFA